jgi:hypothetical protein
MELLPSEVVLQILSYLPYDDIFNSVCKVNRRMQEITRLAYLDTSEMSMAEATQNIVAGRSLRTLKIGTKNLILPNEEVRTNAI